MESEPEKTWYHYASDEQGSTIFITGQNGEVKNRYAYDAFGNTVDKEEQILNRYQYTGQQFDQITQQYYLRARFYNPAIARFTQEDEYHGDGLNLYAYCANNPVDYYDPGGYSCDEIKNPVKHKLPYQPLSKAQRKEIQKKIRNRTATKFEYKHFDWDRRFQNRRQRGVKRFWRGEKNRISNNKQPTREWTERQKGDILRGRVPKDNNNKPVEGHHKYNAADYPHLADDERNIYQVTREEHQYRWHGGKLTNDTSGEPLKPNYPEEIFRE